MKKMKVLFASSEVVPFAKTGGLADVAGSLPLELKNAGIDVRIVMPKYASIQLKEDHALLNKAITVYFIENDQYFRRPGLYGDATGDYPDNLDRFVLFSRQALERARQEDFMPDIVHCHDWQTALMPVYLNTIYANDPFFKKTKSVITIHNLAYQGLFPKDQYPKIGLDWSLFSINCFEFYDKVSLLKAGIMYSNAINTVSPTYATEIRTKEFGCGLDGVLDLRGQDLYGILNGIVIGDVKLSRYPSIESVVFR